MNVLLLYPEFPDTFWSFKYALSFVGKRAALPPLGLLTVAALLPSDWSLRLVDSNVCPPTEQDLAWADCAFISAMVVQREPAQQLVAQCKKAGLLVVAGGPLFNAEHEQFSHVDHFILNEAELTLPPFLEDLAHGHPKRIYTSDTFPDIQQSGIVTAMVGLLQAPAGTRLYARMKSEDRLYTESSGDNVDGTTNIIPAMSIKVLREGYRQILDHIYAPAPYYDRIRTFLREYRGPHVRSKLQRHHILAFLRSMLRLGVFGRERVQYWKLLLWTQFRRPRLLPDAVVLAIYGYHFRKICEKHVT